jgi:hypothetical protein
VTFRAADERAHPAGGDGWWEAWQLDVAGSDGTGVAVQLACAPALGVAWWWTHLLLPDRTGPVVVRDHEVPLPRVGLEVRADGLWGELVCETAFEHWTYGLEAFGVALDDPAESRRGEIGDRMPVGFDLEWELDPAVGDVREIAGAWRGYEQFGVVHGEVLLGRSRVEVDAVGLRSHTWGVPQWDVPRASYWVRGSEAATRDTDPAPVVETIGEFVVPIAGPDGRRAVLTRELARFDAPRGNGWSSRYEPG